MQNRVSMSRASGARRATPWLVLLLAHVAPTAFASPYLTRIAPPPLRNLEPATPVPALPAAAPVIPEPAATPVASPEPAEPVPAEIDRHPAAQEPAAPSTPPDAPAPAAPDAEPPPILQDPLRERVQLEDFLPFFAPPAPAQPASRATYRRE